EKLGGEDRVAERLAHLLPTHVHQAVVHPIGREPVTGSGRLCEFVLVVRKAQVEPATVDVEAVTEVARGHGRALDVPTRAAGTPRRRPGCGCRLRRLVAFPERKVARVPLAAR